MSLKARIEAVLFLTDKPMAAAAIAQLVNVDVQNVRQSILELIHDYEERNSALEIADDGGYMMQVKDEYATFANDLAPIDLPVSIVRTLSAIAIKQPVLQSEIVRIRGAGAYDHIKELLEKELITKKEEGRSSLLNTTKKFQEYFRLSQDAKALRDQLKDQSKPEQGIEGPAEAIAELIPDSQGEGLVVTEGLSEILVESMPTAESSKESIEEQTSSVEEVSKISSPDDVENINPYDINKRPTTAENDVVTNENIELASSSTFSS
jgi:segregation and condensation protein B